MRGRETVTHPAGRRRASSAERGFSLLELMIVVAIMALTVAVAASSLGRSSTAARLHPLAVRIAADLKLARADAMALNRPVDVAFEANSHAYRVSTARQPVVLPASIGYTFTPAPEFQRLTDADRLVFYPDGSSTGAELTLADGPVAVTLVVDWLTGAVTARRVQR